MSQVVIYMKAGFEAVRERVVECVLQGDWLCLLFEDGGTEMLFDDAWHYYEPVAA